MLTSDFEWPLRTWLWAEVRNQRFRREIPELFEEAGLGARAERTELRDEDLEEGRAGEKGESCRLGIQG